MLQDYKGISPQIGEQVFVAESASVIGDVRLADESSVWYNATLRGDVAEIVIGARSNIQDNCVLHGCHALPVILEENVTVGHGAIIHGAYIERDCLIGMGAVVLDNSHIGHGSVIGAGAVVAPRSIIPPLSLVVGVPGKVVRTLAAESEQERIAHAAGYLNLKDDYL